MEQNFSWCCCYWKARAASACKALHCGSKQQ